MPLPIVDDGLICALAPLRPKWKHSGTLHRHHIIQPHSFEDWPLNVIYICDRCHARNHDIEVIPLEELWRLKAYTHQELILLWLIGDLVISRGMQPSYHRVVQRGWWALNELVAMESGRCRVLLRELHGGTTGWIRDLLKQTGRRPVPPYLNELLEAA